MLGITAIYVTHDQAEALSMSDKIVVMNNGQIKQVGAPQEIYNKPADSFVADFIGNANFLEAAVTALDDALIRVGIGGEEFVVSADRAYDGVQVGDQVLVSIKPEAITITEPSGGKLIGRVDVESFIGATTEYKVEFDGQFITVIHSNATNDQRLYQPDEQVALRLRPEQFRVYRR
jgi:iron(III) transport system ATP-binding protein